MKAYLILISVLLLLVCISLQILSLALPKWSTVNDSKSMSLTGCLDCENFFDDYNFECLARTYCEQNEDYGSCKVNKSLYKAGYAYLVLEVLSLLMALLLLEKQVIWMLNLELGQSVILYVLAGLMLIFHLLGTILWIVFSEAKFMDCGTTKDIYDTPDVCIGQGPSVAIANIFIISASVSYFFFIFLRRSPLHIQTTVTYSKVLWLKGKAWLIIFLFVLIISYTLILVSITTKNWVSNDDIHGSLLRCEDCDDISDLGWSCLSGKECSTDDNSDDCKLYRRLSTSSSSFMILEGMSLITLIFFAQTLTGLIKDLNYGVSLLNYLYAILSMIFNLLACSIWFGISSAEFGGGSLIALDGPSLSVVSQFFMIPLSTLFCVIYRFRSVSYFDPRTLNVTIVEKVQDISMVNHTLSESPKKQKMPEIDNINN